MAKTLREAAEEVRDAEAEVIPYSEFHQKRLAFARAKGGTYDYVPILAALDAERAAVLRRVDTVLQDIEFDVDRDALPLTAREHESYIIAKVREALEAETWTPALGSSQGLAGKEGA